MTVELIGLALAMAAVTYPSRALPLLVSGIDRLPSRALEYLRLVGPAVLVALAVVNISVVLDADLQPTFHVGADWLAVGVTLAVVWRFGNLLAGIGLAVLLVAVLRAVAPDLA